MPIIRDCDICAMQNIKRPARVDAKTKQGPWAYLCSSHEKTYGTGNPGLTTVLADVGVKK